MPVFKKFFLFSYIIYSYLNLNLAFCSQCHDLFSREIGPYKLLEKYKVLDLRSKKSFLESGYKGEKNISAVITSDDLVIILKDFIGEGSFASVYLFENKDTSCHDPDCRRIIKIPRDIGAIPSLKEEIQMESILRSSGIITAKILNKGNANPLYLIKQYIPGPTAKQIRDEGARFSAAQLKSLAELFLISYRNKLSIDIGKIENFVWNDQRKLFVLVDNTVLSRKDDFSLQDDSLFSSDNDFMTSKDNFKPSKIHQNSKFDAHYNSYGHRKNERINLCTWHHNFFQNNSELISAFNQYIKKSVGPNAYKYILESCKL